MTASYPTVSTSVQTQIASIMNSQKSSVTLVAERTQFQGGGVDCGLFAIAYATDLCYGNNPAAYRYVFIKVGRASPSNPRDSPHE